jgi:hypothetical protein
LPYKDLINAAVFRFGARLVIVLVIVKDKRSERLPKNKK